MEKCLDNINKNKIYVAQVRSGEYASQWVAFGGKYSGYDQLKLDEDISANFLFKKGREFFKREDLLITDDITIEQVYKNNFRVHDNDIQLSLGKKVKVTAPNKAFNTIGYISYMDPKVVEVLSIDNGKYIVPHEFIKIYTDDIIISDTLPSFPVDDSFEDKPEKETADFKFSDNNNPEELSKNNEKENYEMVNHPKHYRPGIYEAINVIEAWDLNFSLGSAVKYISRCGLKPDASLDDKMKAAEDLRKAAWYCEREASRIIQEKTVKNS